MNIKYIGWCLRYLHLIPVSWIWISLVIHISRNILIYSSLESHNYSFLISILIVILIIMISFIGYVLTWGQLSFWGGTVIISIILFIPNLLRWLYGNYYLWYISINYLFCYHLYWSIVNIILLWIHIVLLHYMSSNNWLNISW